MSLGQKMALLKKGIKSAKEYGIKTTYYKTVNRKKRQEDAREFMRAIMFSDAERIEQRRYKFISPAVISILVPVYNTDKVYLKAMIESVLEQTYSEWQLCIADASDDEHSYVGEMIAEYMSFEDRIVYKKLDNNGGISANTNTCKALSTGDYIAFLDHDDMLAPNALFEVMKQIDEGADFIYTDEEVFTGDILNPIAIHFKPDYAPDTLTSMNYICHLTVINRNLLERVGDFDSECDGSQDYDIILRATKMASKIAHIPKVLYYWRNHSDSVSADIDAKPYCIEAAIKALDKSEPYGKAEKIENTVSCYRIKYDIIDEPKVAIIVVANSTQRDLEKCLMSVVENNTYRNSEIIVADTDRNVQKNDEICSKYKSVKQVKYNGKYKYSAVCNYAVNNTDADFLLFIDASNEVVTKGFVEEMLMYADRDNTGAVGAKIYADKHIWSAGYILGLHGCVGSAFYGTHKDDMGYMYKLFTPQNYSALSSSFMMISADKYRSCEMFSDEYAEDFADIDLCLKLLDMGYVNVFTPFVEVNHYAKDGISESPNKKDKQLFREIWKQEIENGDRYYNVNLSLSSDDFSL